MTTAEYNRLAARGGQNDPAVVLTNVTDALSGLKFGQIVITVHDGTVVQIERIERTRMQQNTENRRQTS